MQVKNGPFAAAVRRFASDWTAMAGLVGVALLLLLALFAPLLANGRPLVMWHDGVSFPFLRFFFAPDSPEYRVEQCFNFLLLFLPAAWLWWAFLRRARSYGVAVLAVLIAIPFLTTSPKLDKFNFRANGMEHELYAPIPYGPFEIVDSPYQMPSRKHWMGTDEVGRDVASRLIYGARVSLAVGLGATALAMIIGIAVGMVSGFFRGTFDLVVMRLVEIVMCFPTFLLLLILMALMRDRKMEQSILVIIAVIGLTGWIGITFLVRGETLRQRTLPFIESCIVAGIPVRRILFLQLLPNIAGPILISFTFGIAGAILAESGLSFLGFGVLPPTASWGGLLRQAFDDPLSYWHLTLFPGIALFLAISSFNLTGEGLRKALAVR